MPKADKNVVVISLLAALAIAMLVLSMTRKPQSNGPVSLQDVFTQAPSTAAAPAVSIVASQVAATTDPVPSPAIVTSPENGKEMGFMVQVYSFQDRLRAEKSLEILKNAGYNAFMEVSDLGGKGTFYRVRIGGLNNEDQAKAMLEQVRRNYQSGIIVKPQI